MRLNGWQRAGVILSIIWAVGAGIHTRNDDVDSANHFAQFAYKVCADGKAMDHIADLSSCDREREKNLKTWMEGSNGNVAFAALAPIPFGWLAAFIIIYISRVQIAGFRAVVPWSTLIWPKKAFVAFCALASVAAVLYGLVIILNLYVDTQVPVGLGLKATVIKSDNFVVAEGTWTRSGMGRGSEVAYPLQASRIECNKEARRCTEARASVAGNVLMPELVDYDVERWTTASIVLRNDYQCATEVFTIDLNTEAVTGAGHPINNDTDYCKVYGGKEKSWNYQLADGFKIYWEQRQKARPLPLRLIQALFGS